MQTNAIVEVKHPFVDFEDKREFHKLVRDKVPSNIERGGEIVIKTRLSGETLLRTLREKLLEEAFEVLDATDQDSIVEELADVSEVIEGILSQLGVSKEELLKRQDQKRKKAGGIKDGMVLLETQNPLPTKKNADSVATLFPELNNMTPQDIVPISSREVVELSHRIDKWSDRREHQAATEVVLRLLIPMVRDSWSASTPETVVDSATGEVMRAKLTGIRQGSKYEIELSIFSPQKQLKLF
jgi:predicted house-cleaning noncanonical NTP pyrophosphatase (MazG superfamily)